MTRRFLTLVGVRQAKIGFKFIHCGAVDLCKSCTLQKVCIENLEPGRVYEVVNVRDVVHPCKIHEDGVKTVEVVFSPILAVLDSKQAVKGALILYKPIECHFSDCPNINLCNPEFLRPGDRCIVESVEGVINDCQAGKTLRLAYLRPTE